MYLSFFSGKVQYLRNGMSRVTDGGRRAAGVPVRSL